jgi:hypothetical protein
MENHTVFLVDFGHADRVLRRAAGRIVNHADGCHVSPGTTRGASWDEGRDRAARCDSAGQSTIASPPSKRPRRMNDPEWLRGARSSECLVQRWRDESKRQFCVLPFYKNNAVVQGRDRYMLWGRALPDGRLYPIPPDWYSLDLVPHCNEATALYQ